jgi:hypothetical protein
MVRPEEVRSASRKVEEENYKFRRFLKIHADPKDLDRRFIRLHRELFAKYDCSSCRNCCKEYRANFTDNEILKAAKLLSMTASEFSDSYLADDIEGKSMKSKPCLFLCDDGSCRIEECKPACCKGYPYTDKTDRMGSLLSLVDSASVCPVVYEIFERLKGEYGFRRHR